MPRVLTIAPGVRFLPTLVEALKAGQLIPSFVPGDDPLALSTVTIFVPTRRAARELRAVFAAASATSAAILPTIRALGEIDDGEAAFEQSGADALSFAPPIASIDRLLLLAPLVQQWKRKLPARVAELFAEEIVIPASAGDSIWLARDLAALMDEVEAEGSDWSKLRGLVTDNLASWWQVTLDFLQIVTEHWPALLAERGQSNPAAHRDALLRAEAERLIRNPPPGPVIAAGSTGSIPGTAELLAAIARLPNGAVVLPGLDKSMDDEVWRMISDIGADTSVFGHPQFGLAKLIAKLGVTRAEVPEIASPSQAQADRAWLVSEAMRPADATDLWLERRGELSEERVTEALADVSLMESANERDEAAAISVVLRQAIETPGATAALVTADRNLARRVATELQRFGIAAGDSGGTPLSNTPPAGLLQLLVRTVMEPGDPLAIVALLKHPLLRLGRPRQTISTLVETIDLIAMRGGTGRPDSVTLGDLFGSRLVGLSAAAAEQKRVPHWYARVEDHGAEAENLLATLAAALSPLAQLRAQATTTLDEIARATVQAFEALGRDENGTVDELYAKDAGAKLVEFLRELIGATARFEFPPAEWPSVLNALIAPEVVKPALGSDPRISIWGALEARLQSADTVVLGSLNEGSWPRKPQTDRLMSRIMKTGIDLEPPERRIGQAAHDFQLAVGNATIVLSRSARDGDAPAVPSRWLQRLTAFIGVDHTKAMAERGSHYVRWGRQLDQSAPVPFAKRPNPTPPVDSRPKRFSITEIETLRRDPYAIYARHILRLRPIDPLIRDPGAADRGTLFHEILHRFSQSGIDPRDPSARAGLLAIAGQCFAEEALPPDVHAVWWPRFAKLATAIIDWERQRADTIISRRSEVRAPGTMVGETGVIVSGFADRIDLLPAGMADVLDFKTGSYPSKRQAHTLVAPQLPLEAALLQRSGFGDLGSLQPAELAYVRLRPNGQVLQESILSIKGSSPKSGPEIAADAWRRLDELLTSYRDVTRGYLSRALPFREGEAGGDYDHLARVLEWSAGADSAEDSAE